MPYRTLLKRSRGEDVRLLQKQLGELGFKAGPVDGVFGFLTEVGVTSFQRSRGLPIDGIVGPRTWAALLSQDNAIKEKLEINLMPLCNQGGRGKAMINLANNEIVVDCWAMPFPASFGKNPITGLYYENYVVWLAGTEENLSKRIGHLLLSGLEYKLTETNLPDLNKYNLLLITIDEDEDKNCGLPILIGSF